MRTKRLILAATGTLLVAAIAGGVASATIPGPGNVYAACMLKNVGTIRLIDRSLPASSLLGHCTDLETQISWNQAGQQGSPGPQGVAGAPGKDGAAGKDGVSVTAGAEAAGANCPAGGARVAAVNGVSYVCNGANGHDGTPAKDGTPGKDGLSATAAAEPAGANCAAGGVQLTAVSGINYVCNGSNGEDGNDGVGVTTAAEPAGANCAHGGSKFIAANGVTYACDGAPGTGDAGGWSLSGNAGTNPTTDYLGTSDSQPFDLRVNGLRAFRLEPGAHVDPSAPNLIGGFSGNSANAGTSGVTIGGGGSVTLQNTVLGSFGTVAGGRANTASIFANVAGGRSNAAIGIDASVSGGTSNTASGTAASVAGGTSNTASGPAASVAGGESNVAAGANSLAAGTHARASHDGSFVWADRISNLPFDSTAANQFSVRAVGGVRFVTGFDIGTGAQFAGVSLAPGSGSWSSLSDRALKRGFARVDGGWVLDRLAGMPVSTWSYRAQEPSIRHLGPTAQDFARAFGLGEDDRHIDTIDSEGVSLAAVKALYEVARTQSRQLRAQQRQLGALSREVNRLKEATQ